MRKYKAVSEAYWLIEGFDSTTPIFSVRIKVTVISERQVRALLKSLTARAGLQFDEIVEAFLMKNTKAYRGHLEVHRDTDVKKRTTILTCGSDPHFVARVVKR